MPKGRQRKGARLAIGSRPASDEEYDTTDNQSTISSLSDDVSIPEDVECDGETDETALYQNFEEKLKDCIDGTSQKSAQGRQTCLEGIRKALSMKYIYDFLVDRKQTLADSLARCLKKGKAEEQALAAHSVCLLCVQLGEESQSLFDEFRPTMMATLADNTAPIKSRTKCAFALAFCSFVACTDLLLVKEVMDALEHVFQTSYLKGNNTAPSHTPDIFSLHSSALSAWTLLLSIAPSSVVDAFVDSHLTRVTGMLQSPDLDVRMAAGETVALMYELIRESDENFENGDHSLCETLRELATDSNKYRAKKDRRQQRSIFRDILHYVEEGYCLDVKEVRFGTECLHINSWAKKKQYDGFCQILGSGIHRHLQANELIREIFNLGPPLPITSMATRKMTKVERSLCNAAAFKARTKARSKHRDKRSVMVNGF